MTEYVWDHRNRLVAVIDRLSEDGPILQSVAYVYDSQNRWIGKAVDRDGDGAEEAVETHFVYQGNQIILQVDGEGEVTNRYLWGPAVDQILADEQVEGDGSSEVLWPLTDHLNTVRDLAEYAPETGVASVVNHIVYDAFGRVTSQTDASVTTLFRFTARPFDDDTGLQNNLNRWYDAETGTWISEDPIGFAAADANLYRYVGNLPTIATDPTGEIPILVPIVVAVWWFFTPNTANAPGVNDDTYPANPIPNPLPALEAGAVVGSGVGLTRAAIARASAARAATVGTATAAASSGTIASSGAIADYVVTNGAAKITVTLTTKGDFTAGFVKTIIATVRQAGATSARVNTSLVLNRKLAARLARHVATNEKFMGGTVSQVAGGPLPIFEIVFPAL